MATAGLFTRTGSPPDMEAFAVEGLPEVRAGEDLAALVDERVDLEDGERLHTRR